MTVGRFFFEQMNSELSSERLIAYCFRFFWPYNSFPWGLFFWEVWLYVLAGLSWLHLQEGLVTSHSSRSGYLRNISEDLPVSDIFQPFGDQHETQARSRISWKQWEASHGWQKPLEKQKWSFPAFCWRTFYLVWKMTDTFQAVLSWSVYNISKISWKLHILINSSYIHFLLICF